MPSDLHNFNYVESSIPEGMTLGQYRRARMNRKPKPVRKGRKCSPMPGVRAASAFKTLQQAPRPAPAAVIEKGPLPRQRALFRARGKEKARRARGTRRALGPS